MDTITITSTGRPGQRRHRISGLTDGDLRLIARAVRAGSWEGGDNGGPVSEALLRLDKALRVPVMYPTVKDSRIIGGTSDTNVLYSEPENER